MFKFLKKISPQYFTFRIYTKLFTPIRVAIFWFLLAFCVVGVFNVNTFIKGENLKNKIIKFKIEVVE